MVFLHIKGKGEMEQFLFEAPGSASLDTVTNDITEIWNLRLKLRWYTTCGKELCGGTRAVEAAKGATSSDEAGSSSSSSSSSSWGKFEQLAKTIADAEDYLRVEQCTIHRKVCELAALKNHRDLIRAAVTMHYPAEATTPMEKLTKDLASLDIDEDTRLKKQHIIHVMSDDPEMADMKELLDPKTSQMWFSGKPMHRDKLLNEYTGKNEKTKIVCKLTKQGQGAPAREPPLDMAAQREMMAYWYKKQEEQKRLEDDDAGDIHSAGSQWADPKALKSTFQGLKPDIRFR